jgi:hypothetical protein
MFGGQNKFMREEWKSTDEVRTIPDGRKRKGKHKGIHR